MGYKKQKDFADYIGVSQVSYNKWENNSNQPSLEMVLKISNKLNLKIDEIVYLEKENGF
ncbi:helix-turn-helix protein [Clostridium beijerinckii]|nr:helix-turn-helix protein [Clostridium beijerinckii]